MAFKVLCVDHVGVAVNDLALIKKQMKDLLNLEPSLPDETVEEQHVTTSFFKPSAQSEACELEFLGSTTPDGPIARYIAKNGGKNGFQHVALRVDNLSLIHISEPTRRTPISYAVFCLKKKNNSYIVCRLLFEKKKKKKTG